MFPSVHYHCSRFHRVQLSALPLFALLSSPLMVLAAIPLSQRNHLLRAVRLALHHSESLFHFHRFLTHHPNSILIYGPMLNVLLYINQQRSQTFDRLEQRMFWLSGMQISHLADHHSQLSLLPRINKVFDLHQSAPEITFPLPM